MSSRRGDFRWNFSGGKRKLQIECVGIWANNKESWISHGKHTHTLKAKIHGNGSPPLPQMPPHLVRIIISGKAHHFGGGFLGWVGLRFP